MRKSKVKSNKLKISLPAFVHHIVKTISDGGFEIYIVGGAVRDILMDKKITDWDFTTNAHPGQILELFPEAFYDNRFGTVGLVEENQPQDIKPYEITTFRTESRYRDARHPEIVEWGLTLGEDLKRRDFTINAMALSPFEMKIIDPHNGQKDLKDKIIRAVGNPDERFKEDALRLMRAVRIAAQLGFIIEKQTFEALKNHAAHINKIAKERVRDELVKVLSSDYPADGVKLLNNGGLLEEILPELTIAQGVMQAGHHRDDVYAHSLLSLKFCPSKDWLVRFATLIHDIGKPPTAKGEGAARTFYNHEIFSTRIARDIARRLKFSKKEREKFVTLVRWHMFSVDDRQTDAAIRRFIKRVGKENLGDILDLRIGDRLGGGARETSWRLELFKKRLEKVQIQPFTVHDLKVNGYDVMNILKVGQGPVIGRILTRIYNEVAEKPEQNERESLLKKIEEMKKEAQKV